MKFSIPHLRTGKRKQTLVQREQISPLRDWMLVLGGGVLLLILGVLYATYLFWHGTQIATEAFNVPDTGEAVYDQKKVQSVLDVYVKKAQHFEEIQNALPVSLLRAEEGATTTPDEGLAPVESAPVAADGPVQVE